MTVNELRNNYGKYLSKIKGDIREVLDSKALTRRQLIEAVTKRSAMTEAELKDRSAGSVFTMYRSIIGTAIGKMQKYGDIVDDEGGYISLCKPVSTIVKETELAPFITDRIKERAYTRREITELAVKYFGADKTVETWDDETIEALTAALLSDLTRRGKLRCIGGRYSIGSDTVLIKKPNSVFEEFIAMLNSKGGEFFESFSAMLLDSYYRSCGATVSSCNVIGGSDDGGIDVMLSVTDKLGFRDVILVQCKQKANSNVTPKEVKEFVGAFYVDKGTRGIFMTTSRFHKEAASIINSLPNVTQIDGARLFEMAKTCRIGIKEENGAFFVDKAFFGA